MGLFTLFHELQVRSSSRPHVNECGFFCRTNTDVLHIAGIDLMTHGYQ